MLKVGSSRTAYSRARLYTAATGTTFNVNSTSYIRIVPLSFGMDLTYAPFTHFRLLMSGLSNAAGATIDLELHSMGGANPTASASGNDLVGISNTGALWESSWIPRVDGSTGMKEYSIYAKGSTATVDLTCTFFDVEFRW